MSILARVAFVATLVWAICMGGLVPAILFWLVYGKVLGVLAGIIGGTLGFLVHRFAWSEDS